MPKLSALFLMQDPGKKFNMLLFKNNTKKTPKAHTLSRKCCLDAKVKPASCYEC